MIDCIPIDLTTCSALITILKFSNALHIYINIQPSSRDNMREKTMEYIKLCNNK